MFALRDNETTIRVAAIMALGLLGMVQVARADLMLTSGYDPSATIDGGVRYRDFGANSGAAATYLGTQLGSGSGYSQQVAAWQSGGEAFTFTYDATDGILLGPRGE